MTWQRVSTDGCQVPSSGTTTQAVSTTSYDIMGLEEDSSYTITVTALNFLGNSEVTVSSVTPEAGENY